MAFGKACHVALAFGYDSVRDPEEGKTAREDREREEGRGGGVCVCGGGGDVCLR